MLKKTLTASVAAFAAVALAACGGGGEAPTAGAGAGAAAPGAEIIDPASVADPATISGTIQFGGDAPQPEVLQMAADPFCLTAHQGQDVTAQRIVVNDNGTLRYVFVYVKEGFEGKAFTASGGSVELSQEGCMYTPHMFGLRTGQTMSIVNNDDTLHNINAQPANNDPFNFAQPIRGMTNEVVFDSEEVLVPIKCDVHGWMQAYIGVLPHPYFSVSGEDGSFTIGNLPAGEYVIAAWHETEGEQTQNVAVGANETAEVNFSFGG